MPVGPASAVGSESTLLLQPPVSGRTFFRVVVVVGGTRLAPRDGDSAVWSWASTGRVDAMAAAPRTMASSDARVGCGCSSVTP